MIRTNSTVCEHLLIILNSQTFLISSGYYSNTCCCDGAIPQTVFQVLGGSSLFLKETASTRQEVLGDGPLPYKDVLFFN